MAMSIDRRQTQLSDTFAVDDLRQMRLANQYNDWIARQIRPYCGQRILEVGAGIGNITSRLLTHARTLCALEPNPACFESLRQSFDGPGFECHPWRLEDCEIEFAIRRGIDTVVCVNVLEHVEDDQAALQRLHGMLKPSAGRLILVVPAVPAAYGPIDAALGHHRRYSRSGLRSALERAGFCAQVLRYSNAIALLGWFFNAHVSRRLQQSDAQIRIFDRLIVPWYSRLEHLVAPPLGLSLLAVADAAR